jgi:hypothetical protein
MSLACCLQWFGFRRWVSRTLRRFIKADIEGQSLLGASCTDNGVDSQRRQFFPVINVSTVPGQGCQPIMRVGMHGV